MAILDLQQRLQGAGRIRIGQQVVTKAGKMRPTALDTFRLTSSEKSRLDAAAKLYGGKVEPWDNDGRSEFELITQSDKLPVVVPPSAMSFSQFYELWSAGGCQRRCTGAMELISEQPCLCDPESRQCEYHTRLSVFLRDVPGLGLWRLDTQGYYAAVELNGAVHIISTAAGSGQMLPATLRIEPREIKRPGEPTRKFVVPVLDIDVTPAQLLMGTVSVEARPAALTPVPVNTDKPVSIADQVRGADNIESRRKRAAPIPSTGVKPRTAAQVAATAEEQARSMPDKPVLRGTPDRKIAAQEKIAEMDSQEGDPVQQAIDHARTVVGMINGLETVHAQTEDGAASEPSTLDPEKVTDEQLNDMRELFNSQSMHDNPTRVAWCSAALRRRVEAPTDLTYAEAEHLNTILRRDMNIDRIRQYYGAGAIERTILDDLAQALDKPLENFDALTSDDLAWIIKALDSPPPVEPNKE
jgi:hypothetical protein